MASKLNIQVSVKDYVTEVRGIHRMRISFQPPCRENFNLAEVYDLASQARSKLAMEAGCSDHNMRRLVLHANMLDCLMDELVESGETNERGLEQPVQTKTSDKLERVASDIDCMLEELEEERSDSEPDSDSEDEVEDDDDSLAMSIPLFKTESQIAIHQSLVDEEDELLLHIIDKHEMADQSTKDWTEIPLRKSKSTLGLVHDMKERGVHALFLPSTVETKLDTGRVVTQVTVH